jgi:hypothetical protein
MTALRDTIKAIVDPIKAGINYVGKGVKEVITLGGTFSIEESATLAGFIEKIPGYDKMSERDQQTYIDAWHQSRARALAEQSGDRGFVKIGDNRTAGLLRTGRSERDFTAFDQSAAPAPSASASLRNIIDENIGKNISINDFSRANELYKFADAFTVDPDLGKEDFSKPNIKIGDK